MALRMDRLKNSKKLMYSKTTTHTYMGKYANTRDII